MLDAIISSKLRVKLLHKFLINPELSSYLRGLESELQVSSNAVRQELNKLEEAGLVQAKAEGNKKIFRANKDHPLFEDLRRILMKSVGIEQIIEKVISRIGDLEQVYLTGALARGIDSSVIDLIFVGRVDQEYLFTLAGKAEKIINKKIRYALYQPEEWSASKLPPTDTLLLYENG